MRLENAASDATFPVFRRPIPPQILAVWDGCLRELWRSETSAGSVTTALFKSETARDGLNECEADAAMQFERQLMERVPRMPSTSGERYQAVVIAVWELLRGVRAKKSQPFLDESLAVALRPAGRLRAGMLTPEICATLYDYHRGAWTAHLTRVQRRKIETALAAVLASVPSEDMDVFWENLHSGSALMRGAMRLGLEWLSSDHAVSHLLCGLDLSTDSDTRVAIVDHLARIGDSRALPRLYALRRSSARTDWPLARRISAAISVIEYLDQGQSQRSLLRPAQFLPNNATLLRPTVEGDPESSTLLRPVDPASSPGDSI